MKNAEGYPDPTYSQALWGIRREERIRALEKKYGVYRGDVVTIHILEHKADEEGNRKTIKAKKVKVVGLYEPYVLCEDKLGTRECFQWTEFMHIWKR